MAETTIWSIGHSNHEMGFFLHLLRQAEMEVVADVRSQPFSRFSPHFSRRELRPTLLQAGLTYVFLGRELGGRPPEPELYDDDGHVLYGEMAKHERFRRGLARLMEGAARYRVAMLCSEEDPTHCHRRLLVTRVLSDRRIPVIHIRSDGTTTTEAELAARLQPSPQTALFAEEHPWRSSRSVLRSTAPKTSSRR